MTNWSKPTSNATNWAKPTSTSAAWTPVVKTQSEWDPLMGAVVFLCTEAGDVLQTENEESIILENRLKTGWTPPTTNQTNWT